MNDTSAVARPARRQISLGARVRIADAESLAAAQRGSSGLRPEPRQMLAAGRTARVTGYRRDPEHGELYLLEGAAGLWPAGWLEPI